MEQESFIEQHVGNLLVERLAYLKITPLKILCLGHAAEYFSLQLQRIYPQATIFTNFENQKFDLIFANCPFKPKTNLAEIFLTWHKNLTANGVLLFSTFGPDTLYELMHEVLWPDMHNIGDLLLQAQFKAPVVDVERFKIEYPSLSLLLNDLQQSGRYAIDPIQDSELNYAYTAEFEVVFGLAWPNTNSHNQYRDIDGKVYVPIESIKILD